LIPNLEVYLTPQSLSAQSYYSSLGSWSRLVPLRGQAGRLLITSSRDRFWPAYSSSPTRMMMQIPSGDAFVGLSKVKQDASPFQHVLQAYERIRKHCPEKRSILFSNILWYCRPRPFWSTRHSPKRHRNRHLRPSEVPPYLHDYMARFQDHLKTLNLPPVEEMWYSQILLGRAMSLTTLHAMCITHGDVKNDCFQISHHPHDVGLWLQLGPTHSHQKNRVWWMVAQDWYRSSRR